MKILSRILILLSIILNTIIYSQNIQLVIDKKVSILNKNSHDTELLFEIGQLYVLNNNIDSAFIYFKKLLEIEPKDNNYISESSYWIAFYYYKNKDIKSLKRMKLKYSNNDWINLLLLQFYLENNQIDRFKKLIQNRMINTNNDDIYDLYKGMLQSYYLTHSIDTNLLRQFGVEIKATDNFSENVYYIQLGIFSSKKNADGYCNELQTKYNIDAEIKIIKKNDRNLYKIISQGFKTLQESKEYLDKQIKGKNLPGFIFKISETE